MLENLSTEKRNEKTTNLDSMQTNEILQLMNKEDMEVPKAISNCLQEIDQIVKAVIKTFTQKGRLIYIGAGTSGRLGVLDAVECVPTFGVPKEMVVGLIAGGEKAFVEAVEGAEDSLTLAEEDLKALKLTDKDFVLGIAASGRTPYVIGGLQYANKVGATTGAFSCNKNAEISKHAKIAVEVDTGSEILTGSTRLKAGTAQKLVLNMISTTSMVAIGKVYKNLMVDVLPTNEKLIERSKKIIMEATECDYEVASNYYEKSGKHVKNAIVMILTGCSKDEAKVKLDKAKGFIKNVEK